MDPEPQKATSSLDRLLSKAVWQGDCLIWVASKHHSGYGQMYAGRRDGKQIICKAHRFSWIAHNHRTIPKGMSVCHTCDNPACINPDHLFVGSHLENMNDCKKKGRFNILDGSLCRGTENVNAKLDGDKVAEIRRRRANGEKGINLAREFEVTPQCISYVVNGQTWRHDAAESRTIPGQSSIRKVKG